MSVFNIYEGKFVSIFGGDLWCFLWTIKNPTAISSGPNQVFYVSDSGNKRIRLFQIKSTFLMLYNESFKYITVTENGNIIFGNSTGKVDVYIFDSYSMTSNVLYCFRPFHP